jgi:hypothetical protein
MSLSIHQYHENKVGLSKAVGCHQVSGSVNLSTQNSVVHVYLRSHLKKKSSIDNFAKQT